MNRLLGTLTAVLTALALAGCATTSGPGASVTSQGDAGAVRPAATGATVKAAAVLSESDRNPDRLRGLSPDAVSGLIGMPHYVRREGGVTVWQYHAGGCVMDLFWYPSAKGTRLAHYEARGVRLASAAEPRTCFGDLLVRRRDAATTS